jgi:mono/diheme cytochrome c family protein
MDESSASNQNGSSTVESRIAKHWLIAGLIGGALCMLIAIGAIIVHAGVYNIAADTPHSRPVIWLVETVRRQSIATRARDVVVPNDLDDPKRIAAGAAEYEEMCSGCHLAPGMKKTEISQGLYPRPPELSHGSHLTPSEEFWVMKHGIKMTGMAAWGKTHDDALLWDVVAFLRKLPKLDAEQYRTLVNNASETHKELMQGMEMHDHDGDDGDLHQ